ncbi:MAG: ATP-binding protein [Butyricicoccus sp.]
MSKKVTVIAVTGGPCGGKSSFLSYIDQQLTQRGYRVFQIAESATELILGGIRPFSGCMNMYDFQTFVFPTQFFKEDLYRRAAELVPEEKVVIVCDRGIPDNSAYVSTEEYDALLAQFGRTEADVLNAYDIVVHLVTTADGAEQAYTLSNNSARTETIEQAREKDQRTLRAWQKHPCLRVIDNSTDFENKLARAAQAILELLGER